MIIPRQISDELKASALQQAITNCETYARIATDVDGVIQVFNQGAERMWGYAASEVLFLRSPMELFDATELLALAAMIPLPINRATPTGFAALTYFAALGQENVVELTCVRKDASRCEMLVSISALYDPHAQLIGYLLVGSDNATRKTDQAAQQTLNAQLRDQRLFTRFLIESDIDPRVAIDASGLITDVNNQMELLTGCTRAQMLGAPFRSYFTEPEQADEALRLVLQNHKLVNFDLTARSVAGTLTQVSYNATTYYDQHHVLQGVFAAARDVTAIKQFERELHSKNAELEYASRMKSEFLANMSHELRTPLNAIIGFSEVLRDGLVGPLTEPQRTFLTDIFSSGTHLLSLINDILDLSKVEAGKMALELDDVDMTAVFGNCLSIIREKAASRHIRLSMDAGSDRGVLRADARKVKQIIYNLLANAVKFTERGQVTLRVENVTRAQVGELQGTWPGRALPLAASDFTEFLKISVTDSGIGISPAGMATLFRPFTQIDSSLSRGFTGTGLGLALVKQLVELHGGAVAVQSQVEVGSCFSVWLPHRTLERVRATSAPTDDEPSTFRMTASTTTPTALVVEADVGSRELLRQQLEAEGFHVVHADSAEAAVAVAEVQALSLITLDINLPNMNGWDFLSNLKQHPTLAHIPVVVVAMVPDLNKGVALGAAAVIQKPLSRRELQDALVAIGMFPRTLALKVLIIDDDPAAMELIATRIKSLGGTVLRAAGAAAALELAHQEHPDLIVLDLAMPEVNGFEVVAALRQRSETSKIPILVITAQEIADDDRQRLSGVVTTIMEKSNFSVATFVTEVRRAISVRHLVL